MVPALDDWVDLYWLPLGAGGHVVPACGRMYEWAAARRQHRAARPLFHSALEVILGRTRHVIEMAPVWSDVSPDRRVVVEGPVGLRVLGRSRAFRYEVRCWPRGRIADRRWAVESPVRVSDEVEVAMRLLEMAAQAPALTWGRDELGVGDMWNSNSLVSWLLASSGLNAADTVPPRGGRAPGWYAGLALAARQDAFQ